MQLSAEGYMAEALRMASVAAKSQRPVIEACARSVCDSLESGGRLWAFGTGHSHLMVEEIWGRAGGLHDVHPILEPSLMLHEGLLKSSLLERQTGLAATLLEIHDVQGDDCLLVASNSGRNAVPVELALEARSRGTTVIALTSLAHSRSVEPRAPSGLRLFEVADHVIDNHGVPGDAIMAHEPNPAGPTSTMIGAMLLQALVVEVVGQMSARGRSLATLKSLNA